jgi:hypothetical protein
LSAKLAVAETANEIFVLELGSFLGLQLFVGSLLCLLWVEDLLGLEVFEDLVVNFQKVHCEFFLHRFFELLRQEGECFKH